MGAILKLECFELSDQESLFSEQRHRTEYEYDLNDRKLREVRPSVAGTSAVERHQLYFYDAADRLVREVTKSATGGADRTINYEYNSLDRLVRKIVGTEGAFSSIADRVIGFVKGKSRSFTVEDDSTYTYEDQLDASLLKTAVNGVASLGFTNEAAPPFAGLGFSMAASQSGNPLGLIEGNFETARDVTGEIAEILKDSTYVFQKTFDPAGRMLSGTLPGGSINLVYDGFGRRDSVVHSDGASGSFQRDLLDRLTHSTWTGATPISESLSYNLAGNIENVTRENGAYSVAYDLINQLVSSTGAYSHSITYDLLGNRSQSSVNGAGSFVNNFLVANGHSSFLGDPDGFGDVVRETSGSVVKNFVYRADGRFSGFSDGSNQVAYYYDALGRRTAKVYTGAVGSFSQSYVYLGAQDRILQAKAGDGSITTYLEGQAPNEHLAESKNGVYKGYVTDHMGSVLNGDAAGTSHRFGLFGEIQGTPPVASPTSGPVMYGWQGLSYDAASGRWDNLARQYNQNTGTFYSQEPIGRDGPNVYWSRRNNPLKYVDPEGLASMTTDMHNQTTTFDPSPEELGPPVTIETRTEAASNAKPGAEDEYCSEDVTPVDNAMSDAYGPEGAYLDTGDSRGRDIHGGGTSLADPYAARQGWNKTMGCTRGQNEDVQALGQSVRAFKARHPGARIKYCRYKRDIRRIK